MTKLKVLQMSSNRMTGKLLDFSSLKYLDHIDLSDNLLTGEIPRSFLSGVDTSIKLFVNLSSNRLYGGIPIELGRLEQLTIQLRGNNIQSIEAGLCQKEAWNNYDVSKYGCDAFYAQLGPIMILGDSLPTVIRVSNVMKLYILELFNVRVDFTGMALAL
eukprot:CAMPEP_0171299800 /NCGR_PEP_ID=MMETSP0816-20121228/8671_1 /TAXON_ID=420281 /ORGANISM="Proboscia inermis, Strain CCAP1064/1" /LENGTH=158 /DNA_ID=CAMNT_0011775909 /DNA_START=407 /DNA_END=884 /DNA_ORIENTATION=-